MPLILSGELGESGSLTSKKKKLILKGAGNKTVAGVEPREDSGYVYLR